MRIRTLTVFGLTGRTGRLVAGAAMDRGWSVRGLARPASAGGLDLPGATVVTGEFSQPDCVAEAVDGSAAVCCVIGPRPPYTDVFCAIATAAILDAMRRSGVCRIVCQTGAMVGAGRRSAPFGWLSRLFAHRQPAAARDRLEQERLVMESGLDWTLVKPPRLSSGWSGRPVRAAPDLRIGLLSSIGRASLARFIVESLDDGSRVGKRLFVRQ